MIRFKSLNLVQPFQEDSLLVATESLGVPGSSLFYYSFIITKQCKNYLLS